MAVNPIQKKMLKGSMTLVVPMLVVIIAVVVFLSSHQNENFLKKTESQIRKGLMAKGRTLIGNNAQALGGMVSDNAFLSVKALVAKTVQEDEDVSFGIYMTIDEQQAWVHANDTNPEGNVDGAVYLKDSISMWISEQKKIGHLERVIKKDKIIEFYSPVEFDEEILGFVRYGLTTKSLVEAIEVAQNDAKKALQNLILIILGIGTIAILLAFFKAKGQAKVFSAPIRDLSAAADIIAGGNYSEEVKVVSDDEVGDLANSFERMRGTVQQYTEHLQDLIDEKMRQVRDILDNIDQGLFTVNMDGTINKEYSKATNQILNLEDVGELNISQTFKFSISQTEDWNDWIEIIRTRHKKLRWSKIIKLAPILEIEIPTSDDIKYVKVDYQPVFGMDGEISRIMVLVQDITAARKIERIVADEKLRHDNEVKTILGLVNNVPESIQEFFKDTEGRFDLIERSLENLRKESEEAREKYPDVIEAKVDANQVSSIFRDLHTIKGNAATYGFERLSFVANEAEDLLELLKPPIRVRSLDTVLQIQDKVRNMRDERMQIADVSKRLRGGDSLTVQVVESKIDYIMSLCKKIVNDAIIRKSPALETLTEACLSLRYMPIVKLIGKYENMVERVAEKLNKEIEFTVSPHDFEVHPSFFKPLNEAMIHILRNAADHGIEAPEVREKINKNPCGNIHFQLDKTDSNYVFTVSDDGGGIDGELIARKAVEKGLVSQGDVEKMNFEEKVNLLFLPGLSTKEDVTDISGRGVGMDSVKESLLAIGADIHIESVVGKGSNFIMEIPFSAFDNED